MAETVKNVDHHTQFNDFVETIDFYKERYAQDVDIERYFGFPTSAILNVEESLRSTEHKSIAYFSMEYGLAPSIYNSFLQKREISEDNLVHQRQVFSNDEDCDNLYKIEDDRLLDIPIYGGGLGVLAGDTLKSVADRGLPLVSIGILWNKGYFKQKFIHKEGQRAEKVNWDPDTYPGLIPLKNIVTIETKEGPFYLRLWKYYVFSLDKKTACPLILLDSNLEQNRNRFQKVTDQLYRSDDVWWSIFQRSLLGIGGMKALESLGYNIDCYHLNEGHAAFALLERYVELEDKSKMDEEKKKFVFTCHTPVEAGHDRFKVQDVASILTSEYIEAAEKFGKSNPDSDEVNLTFLALNNCKKVNAVAFKHGEIMRLQFPKFKDKIDSITNGIHTHTWISSRFQSLYDSYANVFGDWREDPERLANIDQLAGDAEFRKTLFEAHQFNKGELTKVLDHWGFQQGVFTMGWARRFAGYKRPALIFQNIEKLLKIVDEVGPIQFIIAGKAHPNDDVGQSFIEQILQHIDQLNEYKDKLKVMILGNYDTYLGKVLTNSVDVWLNNPLPPFEASGTSGMKATLNGVPQVSTLDGWIVEGAAQDIGWIFGYQHSGSDIGNEHEHRLDEDSEALYKTIREATELYYKTYNDGQTDASSAWIDKMIHCIKVSAFFNTSRMVREYQEKMWQLDS